MPWRDAIMNIGEHLKRSAVLGLSLSVLLALVLSTWVFRAEEADLQLQQRERLAILQANTLVLAQDVTLVRDDLNAVADAILLSRATLAKIRQNLFFAFAYNVLGIPLAAVGLLSPVIAGAAMAASSVSVVSNALLLKRWRPAGAPTRR